MFGIIQSYFAILIILASAACTEPADLRSRSQHSPGNNRLEGKDASQQDSNVEGDFETDEEEPAAEPVAVGGTFLIDCFYNPEENEKKGFCGVFDPEGKPKKKGVDFTEVRVDGDKVAFYAEAPESKYSINFDVPEDKIGQALEIGIKVNIDGELMEPAPQKVGLGNLEDDDEEDGVVDDEDPVLQKRKAWGPHQMFFMSSKSYTPGVDFDSLESADQLCNKLAENGNEILQGLEFVAVMAKSGTSLQDRITADLPIYAADEDPIFELGMDAFLAGKTLESGDDDRYEDESGGDIEAFNNPDVTAWIGANADGSPASDTCDDWRKSEGGKASVGNSKDSDFIAATTRDCNKSARIMCLSKPWRP